jgi:transcriptional regulator with XRE-family HTH domain
MNRETNKILVRNITYLRQKNGMTQQSMSDLLDINRSRLASWEEYRSNPPINGLIVLSNLFFVSVDELIFCDISTRPVCDPFYFNL